MKDGMLKWRLWVEASCWGSEAQLVASLAFVRFSFSNLFRSCCILSSAGIMGNGNPESLFIPFVIPGCVELF